MKITTIDFETFYSQDYSLSKLTTEAYIRDPRFEMILVCVLEDGEKPVIMDESQFCIYAKETDWSKKIVLCHHTHFDGAIMTWKYDIKPALWLDTLSMARAVIGGYSRYFSLGKLAELFEIEAKGDYVLKAKGKRYLDFTDAEWQEYGAYCATDCRITRRIFSYLYAGWWGQWKPTMGKFPKSEIRFIDRIIRMFTEPACILDPYMLHDYHNHIVQEKKDSLVHLYNVMANDYTIDSLWTPERCSMDNIAEVLAKELRSAEKFATLLRNYGVEPPTKISLTTGKETYAFAKTDEDFVALMDEHENPIVQQLVAVRLKTKSTLNETRTLAMLDMSSRGNTPIYYKYSGADQTHRLSGGDKTNFQNLPRKGVLRNTICAPPGYRIVVVDSANIEARVVDTLAMQTDVMEIYRKSDRLHG